MTRLCTDNSRTLSTGGGNVTNVFEIAQAEICTDKSFQLLVATVGAAADLASFLRCSAGPRANPGWAPYSQIYDAFCWFL